MPLPIGPILIGAGIILGALLAGRRSEAGTLPPPPAPPSGWNPPPAATPYLEAIHAAEDENGLPRNFLAAMLHVESRYRDDVIRGEVKGTSGEIGIAQITPRWHPGVDASDPYESIKYAAKIVAGWRREFGDLEHAVAAYNWGPGNLKRKGITQAPKLTKGYINFVMRASAAPTSQSFAKVDNGITNLDDSLKAIHA